MRLTYHRSLARSRSRKSVEVQGQRNDIICCRFRLNFDFTYTAFSQMVNSVSIRYTRMAVEAECGFCGRAHLTNSLVDLPQLDISRD